MNIPTSQILHKNLNFCPFKFMAVQELRICNISNHKTLRTAEYTRFQSSVYIEGNNFYYWREQISTSATKNLCKVKNWVCSRPCCEYFEMICTDLFEYHTDTVSTTTSIVTPIHDAPSLWQCQDGLTLSSLQFLQGEIVAHNARNSNNVL